MFHDRIGERQRSELIQQHPKLGKTHLGIVGTERALRLFGVGDDADRQILIAQTVENVYALRDADKRIDDQIGIKQVPHGRSIGRVPSSRPR